MRSKRSRRCCCRRRRCCCCCCIPLTRCLRPLAGGASQKGLRPLGVQPGPVTQRQLQLASTVDMEDAAEPLSRASLAQHEEGQGVPEALLTALASLSRAEQPAAQQAQQQGVAAQGIDSGSTARQQARRGHLGPSAAAVVPPAKALSAGNGGSTRAAPTSLQRSRLRSPSPAAGKARSSGLSAAKTSGSAGPISTSPATAKTAFGPRSGKGSSPTAGSTSPGSPGEVLGNNLQRALSLTTA